MQGLSTLATIISVLSFPLIFIALLYPHLASTRGKWYAVCLYGGISVGMMLVAVITAPEPHLAEKEWEWADWFVVVLGGGLLLGYITRKYSHLKREALAKRRVENQNKDRHQSRHNQGKKKRKPNI